ncbi:winged helix-turn-helix domain-containing tetratricopeptide repeat protein [Tunturiibacter lichenicola]|uniref:winged helix-turn-helix domain-containing tetratricopeptide repeat protein n=1 Tax=Tunturiibacter lichenicola TaxID=2051959 RepID=UPI003D9B7602
MAHPLQSHRKVWVIREANPTPQITHSSGRFGAENYNHLPMFDSQQRELSSAVRFGDYELDPRRGVLSRNGVALKLQPQPFRVLVLLVARAPDIVTREQLSDYVWHDGVYVDIDQSLNFCIRQIRSVLNDSASNPTFVDTLPKQGYRFIAAIHHEAPDPLLPAPIPAVPISAAPDPPEPTRNGLNHTALAETPPESKTQPSSHTPQGTTSTSHSRLWLLAAIALALAVVGIILGTRIMRNRSLVATPKITSLAVLPLDNLSGDPAQNYFADGMTDELTTMLAKNSTLRIVSRTSAMQYKGAHRPLPEIARELGVDGVLEGSIARTGDKVHMTIQLIQAPTDTHLWAESYDRNANDVVTLPKEAAQTIAKRLGTSTLQPAPTQYVNPEAHDAYLRGRYIWFQGDNEAAGKYFRRAIELQPDYAPGWAGLATYYGQGAFDNLDPRVAIPKAIEAANKAVALDPSLPWAHLALGANMFFNWNWPQAEQEIEHAIELNPDFAEPYHFHAKVLNALGRNSEAIESEKKAMELDPFERPFGMALALSSARQYDAAIDDVRSRLEATPQDAMLHWMLCDTYRRKGQLEKAVQEWETASLLSGDKKEAAEIRSTYEKGGYNALLLRQVNNFKKKSTSQYVSPMEFALQYAQLGRREETLTMLEEAYQQKAPYLLWVQDDPAYDFLHTDERYRALIKKTGLPPMY